MLGTVERLWGDESHQRHNHNGAYLMDHHPPSTIDAQRLTCCAPCRGPSSPRSRSAARTPRKTPCKASVNRIEWGWWAYQRTCSGNERVNSSTDNAHNTTMSKNTAIRTV